MLIVCLNFPLSLWYVLEPECAVAIHKSNSGLRYSNIKKTCPSVVVKQKVFLVINRRVNGSDVQCGWCLHVKSTHCEKIVLEMGKIKIYRIKMSWIVRNSCGVKWRIVVGHDRNFNIQKCFNIFTSWVVTSEKWWRKNGELYKRRTEMVEVRFCHGYSESVRNNWIRDDKTF